MIQETILQHVLDNHPHLTSKSDHHGGDYLIYEHQKIANLTVDGTTLIIYYGENMNTESRVDLNDPKAIEILDEILKPPLVYR